jgi:hypothetical protein
VEAEVAAAPQNRGSKRSWQMRVGRRPRPPGFLLNLTPPRLATLPRATPCVTERGGVFRGPRPYIALRDAEVSLRRTEGLRQRVAPVARGVQGWKRVGLGGDPAWEAAGRPRQCVWGARRQDTAREGPGGGICDGAGAVRPARCDCTTRA